MNDLQLESFRRLHEALDPTPKNWEWIGPHASQRMFGIPEYRAKQYAAIYGGEAHPLPEHQASST